MNRAKQGRKGARKKGGELLRMKDVVNNWLSVHVKQEYRPTILPSTIRADVQEPVPINIGAVSKEEGKNKGKSKGKGQKGKEGKGGIFHNQERKLPPGLRSGGILM